jgi:hypothetical protein
MACGGGKEQLDDEALEALLVKPPAVEPRVAEAQPRG